MATQFDFSNIGSIFAGGMGGTPTGLDALLSEDQRKLMGRNAALSAAAALLQASGRSTTPIGLGQALGSALQAGQQGYQQARAGSVQDLLLNQKLEEAKRAEQLRKQIADVMTTAPQPLNTAQAALAVPGMPFGPTIQRAELMDSMPQPTANELKANQYLTIADIYAAQGKSEEAKRFQEMAERFNPRPETVGQPFEGRDGKFYIMTKTGGVIPAPIAPAIKPEETVGQPFRGQDGKFYIQTKTGGVIPAPVAPAAKPSGAPQQVMGPGGKPVMVQNYDDGTYKVVSGVSPLIPRVSIDRGGSTQFMDPYSIPSGTSFSKTLAPQVVGSSESGYFVLGGGGGGGMTRPVGAAPAAGAAPAPAAGPVPIIPGTGKEPPAAFSEAAKKLNNLKGNLSAYKTEVESDKMVFPSEIPLPFGAKIPLPTGQDTARMRGKYQSLLMGVKDLYELGALTGPDMGIISEQLTNPASFSGIFTSRAAMKAQIKVLEDMAERAEENLSSTYRRKLPAASTAGNKNITVDY